MQTIKVAQNAVQYALDQKAIDPVILDLRHLTTITDFFLILSARNGPQIEAISESIIEQLEEKDGLRPFQREGDAEAHWLLLDYGDIIIHVFRDDTRAFYDLERLWADAKRVEVN